MMRQTLALLAIAALLTTAATGAWAQEPVKNSASETTSPGMEKLQEALRLVSAEGGVEKNGDAAKKAFEAAIAADKELGDAYYNLAVLHMELGQLDAAEGQGKALLAAAPRSGLGHAILGMVQEARGEGAKANASYKSALDLDETQPLANVFMSGKAIERKDWSDARRYARLALVGDPDNLNAYHNVATAYYEQGLVDLAELVCKSALRVDASSAAIQNLLGLVLLKKDDVRSALRAFKAAADADGALVEAHMNAGALTLSYSDFKTALAYFENVVKVDKSNLQARLSRAVALRGLSRHDEALAAYESILSDKPSNIEAHYNRCILLNEYMTDYEKALTACRELEGNLPADHPKKTEMQNRVKGIQTTLEALQEG